MRRLKRVCTLLFVTATVFFAPADAYAVDSADQSLREEGADQSVWTRNEPVIYGEENFIHRLQQRSGPNREPVGLVLSGGSARAFAHIGVLMYLEEQNIVPDFIVSNSMGSIVGLLYAAGLSPQQILTIFQNTEASELFSLKAPVNGGLIDTRKMMNLLYRYIGDRSLEELPIPIMVICEDLISKREIRISEGDLYQVMQAAYALPVYFDPVPYRAHLLIDGGISNLVPVAAASHYTGSVIASTTFYQNPDIDLTNPLSILNIALDITKSRKGIEEIEACLPYVIRCRVEEFSFMEFDRVDEIVQAGYDSAAEAFSKEPFQSAEGITKEAETYGIQEGQEKEKFEALGIIRKEHQEKVDKTVKEFKAFSFVPAEFPSARYFPGLQNFVYPGDRFLLNDDIIIGVKGIAETGIFSGDAVIGTVLAPFSSGLRAAYPGISIGFGLYPLPRLELRADSLLHARGAFRQFFSEDLMETDVDVYASFRITVVPLMTHSLRMELYSGIEYRGMLPGLEEIADFSSGETVWTSDAIIMHEIPQLSWLSADAVLGYQLIDFSGSGVYGVLETQLQPFPSWTISSRNGAKLSPTEDGVPPFMSRTLHIDAGDEDITSMFWNTGTASYTFREFRPSFGEILILRDVSLGVYGEAVYGNGTQSWGLGLEAGCNVSFIGLSSAEIDLFAGYDHGDRPGAEEKLTCSIFFTL